jgi:hypothetical protein
MRVNACAHGAWLCPPARAVARRGARKGSGAEGPRRGLGP